MSDLPTSRAPRRNWMPDTSSGFWRFCLIASLVLNLVILGLLAGRIYRGNPMGKPPVNYGQFVPREFFFDVGRERRRELDKPFRDSREKFDALRDQADDSANKLADLLTAPEFKIDEVNALIDGFTTGRQSVAAEGAQVLKDFFTKLTPEERGLLATAIKERPRHQH
ncbi:periplasmic heavy metal sensor [Aestuariivirga litoralis]|uniref:periplasmic heavy metal sensor n=1 Tax=Aestuariivirga litoralis TaxID=2650924 RepID=UPI0018C64219|nr:periplasmic heavy metal sensor [Aestuariivirga litoralis]MBG1232205.1 periplasmic heavy metal sensor [Aestuariivirga litoralis]